MSDLATLRRPYRRWLEELVRLGIDALQLREKNLADRELLQLAREAREVLPRSVRVLINGRLDVAVAAGVEGVHLPAAGMPLAALRRWSVEHRRPLLLGTSTHRPTEALAAREAGADYATFGPVFPTPSKEAYGTPPGLAGLTAAALASLPLLGLGGVTAERVVAVAAAGAQGVAALRVFQDPIAAAELVSACREAWPPC